MTEIADLIIANAKVITMDKAHPDAEAIAIKGGKILAVGRWSDVKSYSGSSTKQIDAQSHTVMPGINESHIHIFGGSAELEHLSLFKVQGFEAIQSAIRTYAATRKGEALLIANAVDYTALGEGRSIDRHILDAILPDQPLALVSPDHHTIWANTIALTRANILQGKKLAPGNEIMMGADGLAIGELREAGAFNDVMALHAADSRARLGLSTGGEPEGGVSKAEWEADKRVLRAGLKHLARNGITSFQNMDGNFYTLQLLAEIEKEGGLLSRTRIPAHYVAGDITERMDKAAQMHRDYNSQMLSSGTVKFFMDGVIDGHTALMAQDYGDQPGWRGEPRFKQELFNTLCIEADRRGLQIAVHSIGDGSTQSVLDAYEAVRKANGTRDSRHRIEHLELVREADFARIRDLGVVAAMQPPHPPGQCGLPLEPTLSAIGRGNWWRAYAWRKVRDLGIPLVFGSDWPVSSINPWEGIHSAMTRPRWADDQPDNRQKLHETLASYTSIGAYTEFAETWKGQLKPGFAADVIVLDRDVAASDPNTLDKVTAVTTICAGRVTHEA